MGASQRRKGHNYEREVARRFREIFPEAKRGYQTRGGSAEQCDIEGVPFRLECKHHKGNPSIPAALKQAEKKPGSLPALAVTKRTRGVEIASMYLDDFLELLRGRFATSRDWTV